MKAPVARDLAVIAACVLALLAPFLGKAYTIDDPLFLWLAEHIRAAPLDPFGFDVNWYGHAQPMHAVTNNPPLVGYAIALWSSLFGAGEVALHAAFLLPALVTGWATYALARHWTERPLLAALVAVTTPAFVVSSTNVMCDTSLVALWTASLAAWWHGLERGRARWLFVGALLAGLAFLTKYFGLALLPLLLLAGLARGGPGHGTRRGTWTWLPYLLVPVLMIVGYELVTAALYGRGHFAQAREFAGASTRREAPGPLEQTLVGLLFLGSVALPVLFHAPLVAARGLRWTAAGLLVLCAGLALLVHAPGLSDERVGLAAQRVLLAAAGAYLLVLAAARLGRRRDASTLVLAAWVAGTFAFAAYLNWVNNARSNLPIAPAAGILVALALGEPRRRWSAALALVPGVLVALLVAHGDQAWAGGVRDAARRLAAEYGGSPRPLRFQGHWGFQYYLQRAGGVPLDVARDSLSPGDLVIVPSKNTSVYSMPKAPAVAQLAREEVPVPAVAHAFAPNLGASFYASLRGTLPFAFGRAAPDVFRVLEVRRSFRFDVEGPREER